MKSFHPANSFLRVAAAVPQVAIADIEQNVQNIHELYKAACDAQVSIVTFPELSITGYSLGDIVRQKDLLHQARVGLETLAASTSNTDTIMIVGLPFAHDGHLYNCAAVLSGGQVRGLVTKSHLPNYGEFYEQRWYQPYSGITTANIGGKEVPFGQPLLFRADGVDFGVEICEDLWVSDRPSRVLAHAGAILVINPSASPELVGKAAYRRDLVRMTSATERCAYVYASADWSESTTDIVMGGHCLIAENGQIVAERLPFDGDNRLLVSDIDIDHIQHDRLQDTTRIPKIDTPRIDCEIGRTQYDLRRSIPRSYFLPAQESDEQRRIRLGSIANIQAHGLARRLQASGVERMILGLSGGLDSTLALFVALQACDILGKEPQSSIHAITMPGPASSRNTQANALELAHAVDVTSVELPIVNMVDAEMATLRHTNTTDITYENIQARARTAILFNYANANHGLVVGTGDLSELALGWCTFGGDHLSNYNPNASIPKTLVRDLVRFHSDKNRYTLAKPVLEKIITTVISPELIAGNTGEISQSTEELVGPYELHDFFLYHVLRFGDSPTKILYLAARSFAGQYTKPVIARWLHLFYKRFTAHQFKRSTLPDGPKVGSVSISPRGDWRMPSDMSSSLWLS